MMGVQHVIAMFGATVLAPILMGFDPNLAILMSRIGTLIFFFVTGGKVPSYLGSSFAFIGVVIGATAYAGQGPNANLGVALGASWPAACSIRPSGSSCRWSAPAGSSAMPRGHGFGGGGDRPEPGRHPHQEHGGGQQFDSWMQAVTFVCVGLVAVLTRGMVQRLLILVGLIAASIIYAVLTNGMGQASRWTCRPWMAAPGSGCPALRRLCSVARPCCSSHR